VLVKTGAGSPRSSKPSGNAEQARPVESRDNIGMSRYILFPPPSPFRFSPVQEFLKAARKGKLRKGSTFPKRIRAGQSRSHLRHDIIIDKAERAGTAILSEICLIVGHGHS
jgi:hypothetical protein